MLCLLSGRALGILSLRHARLLHSTTPRLERAVKGYRLQPLRLTQPLPAVPPVPTAENEEKPAWLRVPLLTDEQITTYLLPLYSNGWYISNPRTHYGFIYDPELSSKRRQEAQEKQEQKFAILQNSTAPEAQERLAYLMGINTVARRKQPVRYQPMALVPESNVQERRKIEESWTRKTAYAVPSGLIVKTEHYSPHLEKRFVFGDVQDALDFGTLVGGKIARERYLHPYQVHYETPSTVVLRSYTYSAVAPDTSHEPGVTMFDVRFATIMETLHLEKFAEATIDLPESKTTVPRGRPRSAIGMKHLQHRKEILFLPSQVQAEQEKIRAEEEQDESEAQLSNEFGPSGRIIPPFIEPPTAAPAPNTLPLTDTDFKQYLEPLYWRRWRVVYVPNHSYPKSILARLQKKIVFRNMNDAMAFADRVMRAANARMETTSDDLSSLSVLVAQQNVTISLSTPCLSTFTAGDRRLLGISYSDVSFAMHIETAPGLLSSPDFCDIAMTVIPKASKHQPMSVADVMKRLSNLYRIYFGNPKRKMEAPELNELTEIVAAEEAAYQADLNEYLV